MNTELSTIFKNINETKRLPIIFAGSGISKRYTSNDYSWKELLIKCIEQYEDKAEKKYKWYRENANAEMESTRENEEVYQKIGSYIERDFNLAYYEDRVKMNDIPEDTSPAKVYICRLLSEILVKEEMTEEIELLRKLKDKMLTVITTNYDDFLEKEIFTEHEVVIGQKLFLANDTGSLLKIHGSITEPNSLILTERDYENFKNNQKILAARILNLFVDNPVVFLGYSISDPNIRSLLVEIFSCIQDEVDLKKMRQRLVFIKYDENESGTSVGEHSIDVNGIEILMSQVTVSNYTTVLSELANLERTVELREMQRLQELVHKIALDYDGDKIRVVNLSKDEQTEGNEVVVAFGLAQKVERVLVPKGITAEDLFEEVIGMKELNVPTELIAKHSIPEVIRSNSQIPVHKYVDSLTGVENDRISFLFNQDVDDLITTSIKKRMDIFNAVKKLTLEQLFECDYPVSTKLDLLILRAAYEASTDEIQSFIHQNHTKLKEFSNGSTHFRKLIMIYDKKKYKSTS